MIIAHAIRDGSLDATIGSLYDIDASRGLALAEAIGNQDAFKPDFEEFIESEMDLVIETASIEAVKEHGEDVLHSGRDLIILSVGALLDEDFRHRLEETAKTHGSKVIIPSGAIGGMDILKAASITGIEEITLTTTKNPRSLEDVDLDHKTVVFEGSAREAVRKFPRNINVAAALALASEADLKVKILSDPEATTNTHEIFAKGKFGEMSLRVSNVPSPDNPKTSYLAALSVIRTIMEHEDRMIIGT